MDYNKLKNEAKETADLTSILSVKEIDKVTNELEDLKKNFNIINTDNFQDPNENLTCDRSLKDILESLESLETLDYQDIEEKETATNSNDYENLDVYVDAPDFTKTEERLSGLIKTFKLILKAFNLTYDENEYVLKDNKGKIIENIDIPSLINSLEK